MKETQPASSLRKVAYEISDWADQRPRRAFLPDAKPEPALCFRRIM